MNRRVIWLLIAGGFFGGLGCTDDGRGGSDDAEAGDDGMPPDDAAPDAMADASEDAAPDAMTAVPCAAGAVRG
ncbi:MAG: hypothetical protein H6703_08310 [Myxococcales bacterium]|nr:hypothetical protein [Myxococcales bacterium]MCB9542435.1 hypothetical protein [Myxococcales bacterium]